MPSKQNEPLSRGNRTQNLVAVQARALSAIQAGNYEESLRELDCALTTLAQQGVGVADLRRWARSLATRDYLQYLPAFRSQLINLYFAIAERSERRPVRATS